MKGRSVNKADVLNIISDSLINELPIERATTFANINNTRTDLRVVYVLADETSGGGKSAYLYDGITKLGSILGGGGGGGASATTDASQLTTGTLPDLRLSINVAKNFNPTAIKTGAYTAAANDLVRTDATSGNIAITLPTAPADKTRIVIKMIAVSGSFVTNITAGGSDVFNKIGGNSSVSLSVLNQSGTYQYDATNALWYAISSDAPLSQLDLRYTPIAQTALFLGAMTKTQRDAISSPVVGSQIYNSTDGYPEYYDAFWGWMPVYISNEWRRKYGIEYFRDFYLNTSDNFLGTNTSNGGLNNSAAPSGSTSELGGTINLTLNTTVPARAGFTSSGGVVILGSGITVYETKVNVFALSNSTDRFVLMCGFFDNASAIDQVDAVYFAYDEGGLSVNSTATANWQMVTSSNSSRTFAQGTTPIAVVAGTWYTLRVEVNAAGTLTSYYVNSVLLGTISTTIPTALARATGFGILALKSTGTTSRNIGLNYLSYKQKFSTPR